MATGAGQRVISRQARFVEQATTQFNLRGVEYHDIGQGFKRFVEKRTASAAAEAGQQQYDQQSF
jgi:hypothetical protein